MSIQKIKTEPENTAKETTYIIRTGTKHYALYLVVSIVCCKHIVNLDVNNFDNRMQAMTEFKNMLCALHKPDEKFTVEFRE